MTQRFRACRFVVRQGQSNNESELARLAEDYRAILVELGIESSE